MTQQIDKDWLMAQVVAMIEDEDEIDPAENLTLYGVDSISVMRLVAELERRAIPVKFTELAENASVNAWWALISGRQAA